MKNLNHYIVAVLVFLSLKLSYLAADNNHLKFLLKPIDWIVGITLNSSSVYLTQIGYLHEKLGIAIGKSCSGFNFWLIGFMLFNYLFIRYASNENQKYFCFLKALVAAYLLTLFANSSRILVSIVFQPQTLKFFPNHQPLIHETIGVFINLSFLILVYFLLQFRLKLKLHEKIA